MNDLFSQLKDLQSSSDAGSVSGVEKGAIRHSLMAAIGHEERAIEITASGALAYSKWTLVDFISKPLLAGSLVFVLLLGGWMTTVSAASSSLPGDTLYNVKLVTERAKLKLASNEERAILHTEFAQLRLNELSLVKDDAGAAVALSAFKKEIELAGNELRILKDSGSTETLAIATVLDQKIDELSSVLEVSVSVEDLAGAQSATAAVAEEVVDVMVESHEESATSNSEENLGSVFRSDLAKINSRQTFDLGRVAVIRSAINNQELLEKAGVFAPQVTAMEFAVTRSTDRMAEAMNLVAAGGFRAAFKILRDVTEVLDHVENQIAEAEIKISTAVAYLDETAEETNSLTIDGEES